MRRLIAVICLALAGCGGPGLAAHPALAASLCVGSSPGCYPTIRAALNAAHNGEVIHIGPGTFAGGITIGVSVQIIGAGAGATIIKGGGPVLTIGIPNASIEPTVSLTGVTVTGGVNHTFPHPWWAEGGGIYVSPSAAGGALTTVTINSSAIVGNMAQALVGDGAVPISQTTSRGGGISNYGTLTLVHSTVSGNAATSHVSPAPNVDKAEGGGIANNGTGTLLVRNSTISGNSLTLVTTEPTRGDEASGGGILNQRVAVVTVENSTLVGNTVRVATARTGFNTNPGFDIADGGGILNLGTLTVANSTVGGNTVSLATAAVQQNLIVSGGGIDGLNGTTTINGCTISGNAVTVTSTSRDPASGVGDAGGGVHAGAQATVRGSRITGNSVTATAYGGGATANGGGIDADGPFLLQGSTVRDNRARTIVTSALTTPSAFAAGGGMYVNGSATIKDTTLSGNTASATSPAATSKKGMFMGTFGMGGGLAVAGGNQPVATVSMADSRVTGNRAVATTTSGTALAPGGGIANSGTLILRGATVGNNTAGATGPGGFAGGGGIWNDLPPGPPPHLTLINSTITRNSLVGSGRGIMVQGGGLYNGTGDHATVTAIDMLIALNTPTACYPANVIPGCSG